MNTHIAMHIVFKAALDFRALAIKEVLSCHYYCNTVNQSSIHASSLTRYTLFQNLKAMSC